MLYYGGTASFTGMWLAGSALFFSYLVSYIRARAEGAGLSCEVGIFTRAERVIVLALGLMLGSFNLIFLTIALSIITALSFISASQRLYQSWRESRK